MTTDEQKTITEEEQIVRRMRNFDFGRCPEDGGRVTELTAELATARALLAGLAPFIKELLAGREPDEEYLRAVRSFLVETET